MRCSDSATLISRYIDDVLGESERRRLIEHLSICPRCAATLAHYRAMELALRRAPGSPPPVNGVHRLLESMAAPYVRRPRYLTAALGMVACVIATLGVLWGVNSAGWLAHPGQNANPVTPSAPATAYTTRALDDIGNWGGSIAEPVSSGARPGRLYGVESTAPLRSAGSASIVTYQREVVVYALLEAMRPRQDRLFGIIGALPPDALVQRMSLDRAPGKSQEYRLEIVFTMPNDAQYRLQETRLDGPTRPLLRLLDEGSIVSGGQTWRYGKLPLPNQYGETVLVLQTIAGNRNVQLDTTASLPELLEQLDWLR
jgi:hypothetical protein